MIICIRNHDHMHNHKHSGKHDYYYSSGYGIKYFKTHKTSYTNAVYDAKNYRSSSMTIDYSDWSVRYLIRYFLELICYRTNKFIDDLKIRYEL